jgi:hypothetical protein
LPFIEINPSETGIKICRFAGFYLPEVSANISFQLVEISIQNLHPEILGHFPKNNADWVPNGRD